MTFIDYKSSIIYLQNGLEQHRFTFAQAPRIQSFVTPPIFFQAKSAKRENVKELIDTECSH